MNTPEPDDAQLRQHMQRALDGVHAPDVLSAAMTRGRRQRNRRRMGYAAGAVAAVTAAAFSVQAIAGANGADGSAPTPAASDPSSPSATPTFVFTAPSCPAGIPPAPTGWWDQSPAELKYKLGELLPDGITMGANHDESRTWAGNLTSDGGADFANIKLLVPAPPTGQLPCLVEPRETRVPIKPCADSTGVGVTECLEVRSDDGELVGVATAHDLRQNKKGPVGRSNALSMFYLATVKGPDGGQVRFTVYPGIAFDTTAGEYTPSDGPILTLQQVADIAADPLWLS